MVDAARRIHKLKCWPEFYQDIVDGIQTFEVRINDRGFNVGDILILREFRRYGRGKKPQGYTGRQTMVEITYAFNICGLDIFRNLFNAKLEHPIVVMAIKPYTGELQ